MTTRLPANPDDDVYTGIWINRSFGSTYGATLTLDRQTGGLLIAFLALYVGTAGRSFWKIVSFILHFICSSYEPSDSTYHQRQAILRNSQSAPSAAINLIQATIAWKKPARRIYSRILPVLTASLAVSAGFAAAGIFSSRVTTNTANEVLIPGKVCGEVTKSPNDLPFMFDRASKLTKYLTYALQCYQKTKNSRSANCQTFVQPELIYTVDSNASCPFSNEMCVTAFRNLFLDTGYLDSVSDLGLNEGPRFLVRSTRHCAPLHTRSYSRLHTDLQDPSTQFMRYYYGNATLFRPSSDEDAFVYQVRVNESQSFSSSSMFRSKMDTYGLGALYTSPNERVLFTPIPQLDRTDARVSLLFLESSGILYINETADPWFAATTLGTMNADIEDAISGIKEYYVADEPAGVLGCATQRYYCNPDMPEDRRCVNSLGPSDLDLLSDLWPDETERAIMRGTIAPIHTDAASYPEAFYLAASLPALLTTFTLLGPWQTDAIPSNRWQHEMEYTFQASLASLQSSLVEDAMGDPLVGGDICRESNEKCIKTCKSQKIRSSRYYSFSILGMSVILFAGGFIMLLGLFLEDLAQWTSKFGSLRNGRNTYARLEWQANSTLQLQRLAHESLGLGTWSKATDSVPITKSAELLGVLDITDPKHPRLISPHFMDTKSSNDEGYEAQSGCDDKSPSISRRNSVRSGDCRKTPQSPDIELSHIDVNQPSPSSFRLGPTYTQVPSSDRI